MNTLFRDACLILLCAVSFGLGCQSAPPTLPAGTSLLTVSTSSDQASIILQGLVEDEPPVSPRLSGIFTEHLGRNVYYGGAWAQVLLNPVFAPVDLFGDDKGARRWLARRPAFEPWRKTDMLEKLPDMKEIALNWAPFGEGAKYRMERDVHGKGTFAQVITTTGHESEGVLTPAFFPSHRTGTYNLSLRLKHIEGAPVVRVGVFPVVNGHPDFLMPLSNVEMIADDAGGNVQELILHIDRKRFPDDRLAALVIGTTDKGTVRLDRVELYPDDAIDGWDPEVVGLWKQAGVGLIRFPGGNFVSGYHWEDGVGPKEQRPALKNPAWYGCEFNLVGTDEWMRFCELIGAEAMICINAGNGTPEEAGNWVRYCNDPADSEFGKRRAANGHPEPYAIEVWEVGNELWGNWQIGNTTADVYAGRYDVFAKAMRQADESILLMANGNTLEWDRTVVNNATEPLDMLTIHRLVGRIRNFKVTPEESYKAVSSYGVYFERELAPAIKAIMQERIDEPYLALTESMIHEVREGYPTNHSLSEVFYHAGMMNAAIRSDGFVNIITRTALINHGGGMIKDKGIVYAEPVYDAVRLYSRLSGLHPIALQVQTPVDDVPKTMNMPEMNNVPQVDAVAGIAPDGRSMDIIVMNRSIDKGFTVPLDLGGWQDMGWQGRTLLLTSQHFADRNSLEEPRAIQLQEEAVRMRDGVVQLDVPHHSLVSVRLWRD
jgi:alpha-L-arabinofuranosidase